MQEVFMNGFVDELEKLSGQTGAAIVGGLAGPFAGLAAEKGKGWRTAGGAMLGGIGGSTIGALLGAAAGRGPRGMMARNALSSLGGMAGGSFGAALAHGKDTKKKRKK